MLDRCPSEKCFISHYPPAHNDSNTAVIPVLCRSHFDEGSQMPSFEAQSFQMEVGTFLWRNHRVPEAVDQTPTD